MTPLISVGELARLLASDTRVPTLLDVRWRLTGPPGIESYHAGHLAGAVFVDLDHDLAGPPGPGGRHPMPSAAAFQAAMRRAGVRDDLGVVVYDEADSTAAARAWWLLRYFGHQDVRVLDGGYRAWTAAGQPSAISLHPSADKAAAPSLLSPPVHPSPPSPSVLPSPTVAEGDFTARPGHMPLLDAAGAAELARTGLLLDARAAERYRGETEPVDPVAGHIPGAVSAPTAENLNPDGSFRPPAALATRFASLTPSPPSSGANVPPAPTRGSAPGALAVGAYCGSGVTAAHEVLALAVAGIPAALYIGSWSEWITDPARPVATGAAPSP